MLVEHNQTFPEIVSAVHSEMKRGTVDKKHPFRYAVLGTSDGNPSVRYVVLRDVLNDFDLVFYTDDRSEKMAQIHYCNKVEVLLYHPRKHCQIRISGKVLVHNQDAVAAGHWQKVQGKGQLSYNTKLAPGSSVATSDEGNRFRSPLTNEDFTVLHVEAEKVEVLQLGEKHIRMLISKTPDNRWLGEWLVP